MQAFLRKIDGFFMEECSSLSLSLFRIPVALAAGAQYLPTLLEFRDNYSAWAFETKNPQYFPAAALELVDKSPDWLVQAMAALFVVSWLFFLLGFLTQLSCVALDLCCNYFYCLNFTPHGMLSIDILLVTLFLMMVTPYPGDHVSVDAWLRSRRGRKAPKRPIFMVRLLQLQLAITYFHTGLCKLAPGNWWTANPYHYLMNIPPGGIVRDGFLLKDWLASRPGLCRVLGLTVVGTELAAPLLLYPPRLRPFGIALGLFFQAMLFFSLHVPTTTFLFTFPAQILLFIHPEAVEAWFEKARARLPKAARLALPGAFLALLGCAKAERALRVEKGAAVKFRYERSVESKGQTASVSQGELVVSQGSGQVPADLDAGLLGLGVGEKKTIRVPPKRAYGPVNPGAFVRVLRTAFKDPKAIPVGSSVQGELNGREFRAVVSGVEAGGQVLVLDLNHPLAGKTLRFDVEVLDLLPPGR